MTKDEALRLALDALENHIEDPRCDNLIEKLITAIKAALLSRSDGEAKDEPVAWVNQERNTITWDKLYPDMDALYTMPPQRKPLTDDEIEDAWASCEPDWDDKINVLTLARAIEAAHGIKGEA